MRSFVVASAVKDLRRRAADPLALVLWLGIPLLIGGLMAMVSGPSQGARGIVILADEDDSLLGRAVEVGLSQGPLAAMFDVTRMAAPEGRAQLEAGKASALIIVPAGATEAVLDQKPVTLMLVTNPAQRILPGVVQEAMELLVDATFYVQRLFAVPIQTFRQQRQQNGQLPASDQVGTFAAAINDRLRELRPLLLPPALEVKVQEEAQPASAGALTEFGRLFLPGLVFMSLLFIAQGMSADIWEEQTQGTLRRALGSPPGVFSFLMGKVIAGAVIITAVGIVSLVVGVTLFAIPVGRTLVSLPWIVFGGTVLLALFLVPQVLASSQRVANLLASMLVFPLMMIGGSFFPFEAMPAWMATIGRWTPNGQAVTQLKELLNGTATLAPLVVAATAMAAPAIASIAWTASRLRRRFDEAS